MVIVIYMNGLLIVIYVDAYMMPDEEEVCEWLQL